MNRSPKWIALCLVLGACGGRAVRTGADESGDAAAVPTPESGPQSFDLRAPQADILPDARRADGPLQRPLLEALLSTMQLPKSARDFARDIDGNGTPDNQLGMLLGTIASFAPQSLDDQLAQAIKSGALLMLFELDTRKTPGDTAARVRVFLGEDADNSADNNFSGDAKLAIAPSSPMDIELKGKLSASGQLVVEGTLLAPFPTGGALTTLTLERGQLLAQVGGPGLGKGVLTGAIPWTQVREKILPLFVQALGGAGVDPQILQFLDSDGDGRITVKDLESNFLIGSLLRPDVDLDGDGQADALSMGFGFEATRCVIVR